MYNKSNQIKTGNKMKLSALTKKEGQDILKNKIYLGVVPFKYSYYLEHLELL